MAATTQSDRVFTAGAEAAAPRPRVVPMFIAPAREVAPAVREAGAWALARDAAGGLVVLGSWAALWAWFLAATW